MSTPGSSAGLRNATGMARAADDMAGAWWRETAPWGSEPMHYPLPVDEVAYIAALDRAMHFPAFISTGDERPVHIPAFSPALGAVGPNEDVTEEVWQRRSAHRLAGVTAVKRSTDYVAATDDPNVPRPSTPDPTDRRVSKRAWERSVQEWRLGLKAVVANLPTDRAQP